MHHMIHKPQQEGSNQINLIQVKIEPTQNYWANDLGFILSKYK